MGHDRAPSVSFPTSARTLPCLRPSLAACPQPGLQVSPLSLADDPADGWDELLWRQRHAELWAVHERRERTGGKSDAEPSDVEIKTPVRRPLSPGPSPVFPCSPTPPPKALSLLALFDLEIAQSIIWRGAFCQPSRVPNAQPSLLLYVVHVPQPS